MAPIRTPHHYFYANSHDTAYCTHNRLILVPAGTSAIAMAELREHMACAEAAVESNLTRFLAKWRTKEALMLRAAEQLRTQWETTPEVLYFRHHNPEELLELITPQIRDALFTLHAEHGHEMFDSALKTLIKQRTQREADQKQATINKALGLD